AGVPAGRRSIRAGSARPGRTRVAGRHADRRWLLHLPPRPARGGRLGPGSGSRSSRRGPAPRRVLGDTEVYLPPGMALEVPATAAGPLTLHWQGCAEAGICYPPQTLSVALPESADAAAAGAEPAGTPTAAGAAAPPGDR